MNEDDKWKWVVTTHVADGATSDKHHPKSFQDITFGINRQIKPNFKDLIK